MLPGVAYLAATSGTTEAAVERLETDGVLIPEHLACLARSRAEIMHD
ncbi:MAG TPA: hypothetical protein VMF12_09520 [Xanthobacteraceae bacterium]|nr:hypothetical protein [Xanthobacteraceae bacterium]